MRYSLLSRFEGGLLGSEIAARRWQGLGRQALEPEAQELQQSAIATLIRCGRFETEGWLAEIENSSPSLLRRREKMRASEVAFAIVPIALFSHHHRDSLQSRGQSVAELWLHPGENRDELLLWLDAIALVLRERLPAPNLLNSLLALAAAPATPGLQTLERLNLEADLPLESLARSAAPPSPLALALYIFAATAENFSLCLDRALGMSAVSPLVPLLVGAIAGLYNSSSALPARPGIDPAERQRCQHQAQHLFAAWAGTYRRQPWKGNASVVAGAGMLQPRVARLTSPSPQS